MKKILEYVDYFTACLNAVTKGVKTCIQSWPPVSPFDVKSDSSSGDEPKE